MTGWLNAYVPGAVGAGLGAVLLGAGLAACSADGDMQRSGSGGVADAGVTAVGTAPGGTIGSSPLGDYLAGNYALEAGELDAAAGYYEKALAADRDNLDLLRQLFLLTLAGGDYAAALEQAQKLAERDPDADEARLLLALEQVRDGRFEAARAPLGEVSETGVAALALPFVDAWALFGADGGDAVTNALARLDAGESLGPLNDFHTAMMLELGGRSEEARTLLADALPESGPAPARMAEAYAFMLAREGQREAAIELLRAELTDGREQPLLEHALQKLERGSSLELPFTTPAGGMADALLGIAEALHQERGGARAVVYARLATFARPDLAEGQLLIAEVMAEQENYDAALEAYDAVDSGSAYGYPARLRKARTLHTMGREEEAYELLEDVAEARPERTDALVQLGDLLRREEDYERAERAYSRAVERIDELRPEHWTLLYARGITYERTDRWAQAEDDFLKALELEPEQPFVLNYLGYSWVDMGMNLDRAKGMLNRAVELRPNDGYIIDSLGWVHYRLGEYEDAVDMLERAVELEPGDPVINEHLGDAYWRVGREREARYQWRRALSLEPEDDQIAEIEEKLRSGLPENGESRS